MIQVFGEVDKTEKGKVKSTYPSWYYDTQKEELQDSIDHKERMIEQEIVPPSERMLAKERLGQEKERMKKIEMSKPKLTDLEVDEAAKIRKSLGAKIKEAMYTRSDMEKGVADAHEVARRWSIPCIKLDEKELPFAKSCDVTVSHDGKVTQIGAEKVWKIASKLIGEPSNTETLRKG